MKKRAFLVSVALGGLLVASIVFLSSTHSTTAAYSAYGAVPTAIPSVPVPPSKVPKHRPITFNGGVPAVKHPGGGPVTVADVRAFIAINGFAASANGKTTNGTMPVVLQATLMTAQQASALMHGEWPGRPSTAPVIFVELQGPFIMEVTAPPEYKLPIAQKGQELFDATTGDLIVFGGG